jgi:predicted ArsR family transcriptional regulator
MSVEDLVRDEINAELLAELTAEILPVIAPGEVTASQLADYAGINPTNAKELLDGKVKAGVMTCRLVRSNGRRATAYRKV